jgi:hypothetical protein
MALTHTPLDPAALGPDAQRALAPGPARMMAARGLAPLPRPGDLLTVLYQLGLDADATIRDAAQRTAAELPERVLVGGLDDASLDPRVIDRFALEVLNRPALLQRIILNPATSDQTIADLAGMLDAAEIDLVAQNEERLLRHPEIIGAMYKNRRARMSTVDRAVELAVRNQVEVPDIPAWDEIVSALMGKAKQPQIQRSAAEDDALFAQAAAVMGEEPRPATGGGTSSAGGAAAGAETTETEVEAVVEAQARKAEKVPLAKMTVPMKIRLATLGNAFARSQLVRDPLRAVALAAIKAPGVTDGEAAKYAGNQALSDDVINYIADRREWTKLYNVKLALVQNPKTPMRVTTHLMAHLREKDLRTVSRSKNIPSAVAAQARKLISARSQRSGGGEK